MSTWCISVKNNVIKDMDSLDRRELLDRGLLQHTNSRGSGLFRLSRGIGGGKTVVEVSNYNYLSSRNH